MTRVAGEMEGSNSTGPTSPKQIPPKSLYPFGRPSFRPKPHSSSDDVVRDLRALLDVSNGSRSEVWPSGDRQFKVSTSIFNGAIETHAIAVVRPVNAQDVSRVVLFCRQQSLELSVKAGGTGVHGESLAGQVILDLSSLNHVSISKPTEGLTLQESFASLRLGNGNRDGFQTKPPQTHGETSLAPPKRPSLATSNSSDSTTYFTKRNAEAMSEGDDEPDSKRRMDPIEENRPSRSSHSDSLSMVDGRADSMSSSRSGRSELLSSGERDSTSTPGTSSMESGAEEGLKLSYPDGVSRLTPVSAHSSSSSPSSASSHHSTPTNVGPQPRLTYLNPSPTVTKSYPFISTTFGSGPSSAASSFSPYGQSFTSISPVALNDNPNPPEYTIVTFGAGVHSKQLDAATARSPYGAFHVPTSAFPVGSGQFMLGGFGFLGRKYGLAMDNLLEAEMVLADGRIVWVGEGGKYGGDWHEDEDPSEVWWGIRGAGPALGIVTRFRAKAFYVPSVFAGNLIYVFDRQTTPSLLRHVRDCIKGAPRSLYTNVIMTAGPLGSPAIVVIQMCYSGPCAEGDGYVQAINAWEGGRCLFQDFSERTFERQQVAVQEVLKDGSGKKWFIKSDTIVSLDDRLIEETCARFGDIPDGCTWLFEYTGGGAMADVKDTCFPSTHRQALFTVAALHQWGLDEPPKEDQQCVTTAEHWIDQVIHSASPGGPLPCFLQTSALDAVSAVYGDSWPRLLAVKKKIDPDNFFRHTMWPHVESEQEKDNMYRPNPDESVGKHLPDGDAATR